MIDPMCPTDASDDWLDGDPPPVPQPQALERIGEVHLLGPPGCGKTYALTTVWLPRAIERYGSDAVAVVSLTKVASLEIASRQAVPLDRSRVRTLHSMCHAIVRDTTEITIVKIDAAADVKAWNDHVASSGLRRAFRLAAPRLGGGARRAEDMFGEIDLARSTMAPISSLRSDAQDLFREWGAWKHKEGLLDFTDLVEMVYYDDLPLPSLNGCEVEALIVDEAQDLCRLDYAVVRQWAKNLDALILAGDPDQAIFEFRGAAPDEFHDPGTWSGKTFELAQSYRMPPAIAEYAEHYHDNANPDRVGVKYTPRASSRPGDVHRSGIALDGGRGFSKLVAGEIEAIESFNLDGAHRDVMILSAEGFVLQGALTALTEAGIRYHNPYKPDNNAWNPEGKSIGAVRAFGQARYGDGWTWANLRTWACECAAVGFMKRGQRKRLEELEDPDELKVFVDADGLAEVFVNPDVITRDVLPLFLDIDGHDVAIEWLEMHMLSKAKKDDAQKRVRRAIDAARIGGFEALSDRPKVVVGTIHSVKGATAGSVILSPNISPRRDLRSGEVVRMFYVGMTRASERLVLTRPSDFGRSTKAVNWPAPGDGG